VAPDPAPSSVHVPVVFLCRTYICYVVICNEMYIFFVGILCNDRQGKGKNDNIAPTSCFFLVNALTPLVSYIRLKDGFL
jgi:hypothetical protein